MDQLKVRAGEPQESFVRAVYAEMLLDKAEAMNAVANPGYLSLDTIENPGEESSSLSPSAWSLKCYQESFEDEMICRDLFDRLSEEAKQVLKIFLTTPAEVTEALMQISVGGEARRPDHDTGKVSMKRLYKPARVRQYLKRFFSPAKISRVFKELNHFFKESTI